MTETSLIPQAAAAAGLSFDALCERLVQLAAGDAPAAPATGPAAGTPATAEAGR